MRSEDIDMSLNRRHLAKWVDWRKLAIRISIFLLFTVIAIITFRGLLGSPGVIGLVMEWSLPPFAGQYAEKISWDLSVWNPFPDLGQPSTLTVGLYFDFFVNFLYSLGLDGDFVSKFLSILLFSVAGLSAFYLSRKMELGRPASLVMSLVYMLAPAPFNRFVLGHIYAISDYSLLPLVIALFIGSLKKRRGPRYFMVSGILLTLALSHMTSFFLVFTALFLFSVVHSLHEMKWGAFVLSLRNLAAFFIIPLLLHSFWILPIALQALLGHFFERAASPVGYLPLQLLVGDSPLMELPYTLRLTGYHGAFFRYVGMHDIGDWVLNLGYLMSILAFATVLFKPKRKEVIFAALLALTGVLIASAQRGPLGPLWYWLFAHLPFLWIFRDPNYWIHLTTLGYALLLGFLAQFLMGRTKRATLEIYFKYKNRNLSLNRYLVVLLLLTLIIFYGSPYLTGDFGGFMQTYAYSEDHRNLWQWSNDNPEDFRILSTQGPYPNFYNGADRWGYDMMVVYGGKPGFYFGKVYDPQIVRFFYKTIQEERTENLGELLGLMNIKYLVFDTNKRPGVTDVVSISRQFPEEAFTNDKILTTLSEQKDIFSSGQNGSIQIYENAKYLPHIFPISQIALYAGNLDGLISMSYMENMYLKDLGMVFVNQGPRAVLSPEDLETLAHNPSVKVVIQEGHLLDLLITACPQKQVFNLFDYVEDGLPTQGWRPLWWLWYNWHYQAELMRVVFTFIPSTLTIPYSIEEDSEYHLFLKPYFGPKASLLRVSSDNVTIGEVTTRAVADPGFQWVDMGSFSLQSGSHRLQIESDDGENALGGLAIIPQTAMEQALQEINELMQDKDIILLSEFNSPNPVEIVWSQEGRDIAQAAETPQYRAPQGDPYYISVYNGTFVLTQTFSHGAGTQEAFCVKIDTSLNLKGAPFFAMNFKNDNPDMQYPIFRLYIDTDGDGERNYIFRSYEDQAIHYLLLSQQSTEFRQFEFNVLDAVKAQFPGKDMYRVVGVELDFRKFGDIDSSGELRGNYTFHVKGVQFSGSSSTLTENWVQASQGEALSITCTNATPVQQSLSVPRAGTYKLYLRAAGGNTPSKVAVKIDSSQFDVTLNPISNGFEWYDLGQVYLAEGSYNLTAVELKGDIAHLDLAVLADPSLASTASTGVNLTSHKISYSKYTIHAQASEPFYIFFSERYDSSWRLRLDDGTELSSYPGYSFGNLFYIDKTGEFDMTLEYPGQKLYEICLTFSFICFGVAILGVVIPNRALRFLWRKLKSL